MRALLLASVCTLLLASDAASAQPVEPPPARPASWVSVGASSAAPLERTGTNSDALLTVSADYHRPTRVPGATLQVGASSSSNFFSSIGLNEAHVAAAASVARGPLHLTVAAGPSVGRADPSGGPSRSVVGLIGRAEAVFVVVPAFGIGGHVFGHLNSAMTVAGAGLTLAFGRLPGAVLPNPPQNARRPGP